jgi:oleate hydratase
MRLKISYRFAFQSWHSAVEFRRYLHKYFHEFLQINTLEGVDHTPYNQYDSIILPIEAYLKARDVDFKYSMPHEILKVLKSVPLIL